MYFTLRYSNSVVNTELVIGVMCDDVDVDDVVVSVSRLTGRWTVTSEC